MLSGDGVTDLDLSAALAFHREHEALATMVLTRVDNPLEYGVVVTAADGRVRAFLEKPGPGEAISDTVNTGIYILEPEILAPHSRGKALRFRRRTVPALGPGRPRAYYALRAGGAIGAISAMPAPICARMPGSPLDGELSSRIRPRGVQKGALVHEDAQRGIPLLHRRGRARRRRGDWWDNMR